MVGCSFRRPSIIGSWADGPLKGTVEQAKKHWYSGDDYQFPPGGHSLEVAYSGEAPNVEQGRFRRENLDVLFFAWLSKYQDIKNIDDEAVRNENLSKFHKCTGNIPARFNLRTNSEASLKKAYQFREDEEKGATLLGHSVLLRARELVALQD